MLDFSLITLGMCIAATLYLLIAYFVADMSKAFRDARLGRHNLATVKRICALIWPIGAPLMLLYAILFSDRDA